MFAICLSSLKGHQFICRLSVQSGCRVRKFSSNNSCYERVHGRKYWCGYIFGKYLIWTNVLSCGILMSVGDLIEQQIEFVKREEHKNGFDWRRNMNMSLVGAFQGLLTHFFYQILDRCLPGVKMVTVAKKVMLDQSIASPVCLLVLFGGMEILGDRDFEAFKSNIKDKFGMVFAIDCAVWMPAQFINFYLLPATYRVIYVNILTMCYNVFLSFMIHS